MTKGNNGTGNVAERDEWQTPQRLWDDLDKQYNFKYDCCASHENSKCKFFSSKRTPLDLSTYIKEMCWMNPPFSIARNIFKTFFEIVNQGVAIYRSDNIETGLWQDIIFKNATWVFQFKGRINYEGMKGKGSRFQSALIGYNVPVPKGLKGTLLIIHKQS